MRDAETPVPSSAVDIEAVARWMDAQGLGHGGIDAVEPIGGGTQNVMLAFRRAGTRYVLRRGPRHLRPGSNDGLRREIRLLGALASTDVPHPRLLAACPGGEPLGGATFYLMAPVDGFNPVVDLGPRYVAEPTVRHRAALATVDALTTLAAVDHRSVGLEDFGRPEGFLERQVPRWLGELDGYHALEGYDGPDLPDVAPIAAWLTRRLPSRWSPGILHGDYHLGNVMLAADEPRVAAIVDWEMATIGDPLLDLGWLLATWPRVGDPGVLGGALIDAGGLPTAAELVARYAEGSARDLTTVDWYTVLACFKLAIVLEGTHARACAGRADRATGDRLHAGAVGLLRRAAATIERA